MRGQRVRYVAGDLSPVMLRRARAEAKRRELDQIVFTEADVEALPFEDASFDLCVSYTDTIAAPHQEEPSARTRRRGCSMANAEASERCALSRPAAICGALGIRVTDGSQLDDTLDTAAAHDALALIAIVTDPDVIYPGVTLRRAAILPITDLPPTRR